MKKLDKILTTVAVFFLLFVVTMIVVFCKFGAVPDTLIQYTLGGCVGELVCAALIKVFNIRHETKEEDGEC